MPGSMTQAADGKITVIGGGSDIWGTSDNFHYAYFKVTGDFDYVMKVESLVGNSGDGGWSKVELMARVEDPAQPGVGPQGGDPHLSNMTTRKSSDTANSAPAGVNYRGPQWRAIRDNASSWTTPNPGYPPNMPDNWMRLERIGSVFYMYTSNDGTTWNSYNPYALQGWNTAGSWPPGTDSADVSVFTEAWPATLFLGIAITAHSDADVTTAVISDFGPYTPKPIAITKQPEATVALSANTKLTLSVEATGDPIHYEWRKDGVPVATNGLGSTYTVDLAQTSDAGSYTVRLFGGGKEVISAPSVVSVTVDTTAPTLAEVSADSTFTGVVVKFSEPVGATAEAKANYAIDNGVTVNSVSRIDAFTVKLATTKLAENSAFTLTANNVQDIPGNKIAADSKATFKSWVFVQGAVLHKFWANNTAANIQALLDDPRFPDAPTLYTMEPRWEYGPGGSNESGENYGNQLVGWFIPAQSGNYIFFTNSDDPSNLYLSTDEDPANKHLIAQETGWSDARNWVSTGSGSVEDKRSDYFANTEWPNGNSITLQAGKRYYMESLHVEGGGGDSVAATFILEGEADPVNGDAPKVTGSLVGTYMDPTGATINIHQQPQNVTAGANSTATFTVAATGSSRYGTNVTYQWQKAAAGSSTFANIAGATTPSYITPLLTVANNGEKYRAVVTIPPITQNSAEATLSISGTAAPDPARGAVAYWNLDGNLEDWIKDFDGTARGANPVPFVDSKAGFGKAIKLDGIDQFVEITGGNENELEFPGGSMSIAGWFTVDTFDTSWQALIAKGEGTSWRVARNAETDAIAYAGGVGEGPADVPAVNDGAWHHFVAVSDSTAKEFGTALYVDGTRYSVQAQAPLLTANSSNVMIGENPGALGRQWAGSIDDIAIWNRVLLPEEIAQLWANGAGKPLGTFLPPPGGDDIAVTVSRSGGNLTIQWSPTGGTLETTSALGPTAVWTPVGAANPATVTLGTGNAYYRVRK